MADNLSLQALARIQALDARNVVAGYRLKWTGGVALEARAAIAWMRDQLGAPAEAVRFEPRFDNPLAPSLASWKASGADWLAYPETGEPVVCRTALSSAGRDLGELVCALGAAFRREWIGAGAMFVLTGALPVLDAVSFLYVQRRQEGGLRNVSGPLSDELVLFVRPQATLADVTDEYQRAQRRVAELTATAPRERTKPIGSPRVRDLAVLGARIALGDFASWAAAMDCYNAEHGAPVDLGDNEQDVTYADEGTRGRFRRDVRAAYQRVTGLDIDFQPDRRGGLPVGVLRSAGETVRVPTARNAQEAAPILTEEDYRAVLEAVLEAKSHDERGQS